MLLLLLACAPSPSPGKTHESSSVDSQPAGETDSPVDSAPHETADTADTADTAGPTDTEDSADSADSGSDTWRSALYPDDWTSASTDDDGHFLHDFSYAGYHASEDPLPSISGPLFSVDEEGADPTGLLDSTDAIQAAIDAAALAGGGVVTLSAGTYLVDGTLRVSDSDIVLRGEGSDTTFLRFTLTTGMDYLSHLTFKGTLTEGADLLLSTDGEARATVVALDDASSLAVGDRVHLGWTITDEFVDEHGMTDTWVSFNGEWRAFFRRTITAIDTSVSPDTVTLDVPLRYPAKTRDGASLRLASGYLSEVGVEGLSVTNVATWAQAWAETQTHVIEFNGVEDGWIEDVASYAPDDPPDEEGDHLMSGGVLITDSRRVTVADASMEEAQNRGDGGNGYLFEIRRSNEVLTRDSLARAGRHNFIQNWDFGTSGCVWLRTTSEDGEAIVSEELPYGYTAYSEFHHSLAMANLIDQSVATDGWQGVNRQDESSGAGHSVTESVFWNLTGGGYLRSLQYGEGYVIGTDDIDLHVDPAEWDWNNAGEGTDPEDWTEGIGEAATLDPPSLFEDQLSRRVGASP